VDIEVSLLPGKGLPPASLKWEVIYPAQLVEFVSPPLSGAATMDAGKSLACAPGRTYSHLCLVAGGRMPLAGGTVAILHFKIRSDAPPGNCTIRIDHIDAVTSDLKAVKLTGQEGQIEIQ